MAHIGDGQMIEIIFDIVVLVIMALIFWWGTDSNRKGKDPGGIR